MAAGFELQAALISAWQDARKASRELLQQIDFEIAALFGQLKRGENISVSTAGSSASIQSGSQKAALEMWVALRSECVRITATLTNPTQEAIYVAMMSSLQASNSFTESYPHFTDLSAV